MSNPDYIEFRKVRDLGRIISDTLGFLRNEWQPLFSTIIRASIIPIVIALVIGIYFTGSSGLVLDAYMQAAFSGDITTFFDYPDLDSFFMLYLLFVVVITFATATITTSILAYIKSYVAGRGIINYDEVRQTIKEKMVSLFIMSIIISIISTIGTFLCILPGIYFIITLSMAAPILIFQERGMFDSIGDAFNFIKGHWWDTFGMMLVIGILIIIVNWILNLPMDYYVKANIKTLETTDVMEIIADPIYIVFIIVSFLMSFLFNIISTTSGAFIYFDIEEQENPSTPDIINEIGSDF